MRFLLVAIAPPLFGKTIELTGTTRNPRSTREQAWEAFFCGQSERWEERSARGVLSGTELAARRRMAKTFGAAGEHAARQSVDAFKKMFLSVTIFIGAMCLCWGIVWTLLFTRSEPWFVTWTAPLAFLCAVIWACKVLTRRIEKYESDRMSWRMGALGECEVAAELERLSDEFIIFNNVNTKRGNLDHVVIGPTGLFAIETKNWTGMIAADASGELVKNGRESTTPHVKKFVGRAMMVRDQLIMLNGDEFRVKAVMVFPKAYLDAPWGKTGNAHCVQLKKLFDYIENEKYSTKFSKERVAGLVRALEGIANMDVDFVGTPTGGVRKVHGEGSTVGHAARGSG